MNSEKKQISISKHQWKSIIEEQKQFDGSARAFCELPQINLLLAFLKVTLLGNK